MDESLLGKTMRDSVSGFQGVCVCIATWVGGVKRATLQPPVGKDGKLPEAQTFDAPNVIVVAKAKPAGKPAIKMAGKPMVKRFGA